MINHHHKEVVRNLQRLSPKTPRTVIYFLAGSLPAEALLHIRQLTLFGMISRLPHSLLHAVALTLLRNAPPAKSWFAKILLLFKKYDLDHQPLDLLCFPPTKDVFKKLVKKKVLGHWEQLLRAEANDSGYSSLTFFKPQFMSLTSPHPLWTSAGSSPANIAMATVQAQMLSGRFPTERTLQTLVGEQVGFLSAPLYPPGCCRRYPPHPAGL